MLLSDKTCVIVGASGAIGTAVSVAFYREGARLALTCRSTNLDSLVPALPSNDPRIVRCALDVCDPRRTREVLSEVAQAFGPVSALVNCSGVIGPIGPTASTPSKDWIEAVSVNLIGSFNLAQAVIPHMIAAGSGKIIFFSGGGAAYGRPFFTAYAASKAALVRFTESLAAELTKYRIDVNAIAPGPVKSRMWEELRAVGSCAGAAGIEDLRNMDRTGGVSAENAAELAAFLVSDRSDGLSGRLISAVHDDWRNISPHFEAIRSSDAWTLRRIPLR